MMVLTAPQDIFVKKALKVQIQCPDAVIQATTAQQVQQPNKNVLNILSMINVRLKKSNTAKYVRQVTIVAVKLDSPNSQTHCVVLLDLIVNHKLVQFCVLVGIIVRWDQDGNKPVRLDNINKTEVKLNVNHAQKVFIVTHMSLELEPA